MAFYTEAEARKKRSFTDCGDWQIVGEGQNRRAINFCIASDCIGWVFDDGELERYVPGDKVWSMHAPGRRYTQDDVPKPDGTDVSWMTYAPYLNPPSKEGWWARPNQNRKGHCGRVLTTALLEQP